jgi:arsenate reductase
VRLLQSLGCGTAGFRSKSWGEFARPGSPALDFVFTVCDNAAGEACPVWPGQPMTAHWGVPDPAEASGSPAEVALAFKDAYRMLHQRIAIFAALPLRSLDQLSLQTKLKEIGRIAGATAKAADATTCAAHVRGMARNRLPVGGRGRLRHYGAFIAAQIVRDPHRGRHRSMAMADGAEDVEVTLVTADFG